MELENKKLNNLFIHFYQERNKNLTNKSGLFSHTPNSKRSTSVFNLRNNNNLTSDNKKRQKSASNITQNMQNVNYTRNFLICFTSSYNLLMWASLTS